MARTREVPAPDDPRKPRAPRDVTSRGWLYVARTTAREFLAADLVDLAAALTFYSVLSLFPALIALVSILNLTGQGATGVEGLENIVGRVADVVGREHLDTVLGVIEGLFTPSGAGVGLVVGVVVALWSASRYLKAFGRAMNRIYDVPEGRPFWKYYLQMYAVTVVLLLLVAAALVLVVVSGSAAEAIGDLLGLGPAAVAAWNVAKWPALAVVVVVAVALLYYATPNVRQPRLPWVSVGAVAAILVGTAETVAFALVISRWNLSVTYGALAGVIAFLVWLWLINIALLFGGQLNAELERARQLQGGIRAEREIQLPPRDTRISDRRARWAERDVERGTALRLSAGRTDDLDRARAQVEAEGSANPQVDEGPGADRPGDDAVTRGSSSTSGAG